MAVNDGVVVRGSAESEQGNFFFSVLNHMAQHFDIKCKQCGSALVVTRKNELLKDDPRQFSVGLGCVGCAGAHTH